MKLKTYYACLALAGLVGLLLFALWPKLTSQAESHPALPPDTAIGPPGERLVTMQIAPNEASCPAHAPMAVYLTNVSSDTQVARTSFSISVSRAGYSTMLAHKEYATDKIMAPGEEHAMCVTKPWINFGVGWSGPRPFQDMSEEMIEYWLAAQPIRNLPEFKLTYSFYVMGAQ